LLVGVGGDASGTRVGAIWSSPLISVVAGICNRWMPVFRTTQGKQGRRRYFAWIAVIVTAFTMSSVVQPLDRSLDGFFRPCRIGPIAVALARRSTSL
jgi:hypothetical protein